MLVIKKSRARQLNLMGSENRDSISYPPLKTKECIVMAASLRRVSCTVQGRWLNSCDDTI